MSVITPTQKSKKAAVKGPVGGYDFGNKRQYRRTLWNFIDQCLKSIPIKERSALILDTSDAEETFFLIARGYLARNITVVNTDRTQLAWINNRVGKSGNGRVNTRTGDVFSVMCCGDTNYDAINLDLMGPVCDGLMQGLSNLPVKAGGVVSVSVLRGRERGDYAAIMNRMAVVRREIRSTKEDIPNSIFGPLAKQAVDRSRLPDYGRLFAIAAATARAALASRPPLLQVKGRWGQYRSTAGSQTMLWYAQQFESTHRYFELYERREIDKHSVFTPRDLFPSHIPE